MTKRRSERSGVFIYKFIEALAAAGVTAGCGDNLFCADRSITRGEVAVWLAAALGMHYPN